MQGRLDLLLFPVFSWWLFRSRFLVRDSIWQNPKDFNSKWKVEKEKLKSALESDSFGCL